MNKEELLNQMYNDSETDKEILRELQEELDKELNKPFSQQDLDYIDELTEVICEIRGESDLITEKAQAGIKYIQEHNDTYKVKKTHKSKTWVAVLSCCVVFVVLLNFASLSTLGMNIFSAAYQISKGGITIDLKKKDPIKLPETKDDPYGIKAKCAEYGIYPETPSYIPEGFELVNIIDDINESWTNIIFYYKKSGVILHLDFRQYNEGENDSYIGMPTDTYNVVEEEINDHIIYILKEDNQFTATFVNDNIVYLIYSDGLDYDECQLIIESLSK